MYIRRTKTSSRKNGEEYSTYRLVESVREGKAVRQRTLLNLGAEFDVAQDDWAELAARINDLLHGQPGLLSLPAELEALAGVRASQRCLPLPNNGPGMHPAPANTKRPQACGPLRNA